MSQFDKYIEIAANMVYNEASPGSYGGDKAAVEKSLQEDFNKIAKKIKEKEEKIKEKEEEIKEKEEEIKTEIYGIPAQTLYEYAKYVMKKKWSQCADYKQTILGVKITKDICEEIENKLNQDAAYRVWYFKYHNDQMQEMKGGSYDKT